MFHRISKTLLFALLLIAGIAGAHAATEDTAVNTSLANLRVGPNRDSRIITALPHGTKIEILGYEGDYAKVRVKRTGISGWVYAPAQRWNGGIAAAPASGRGGETAAQPVATTPPPPAFRSTPALAPVEIRLAMDAPDSEVLFRKEPFDTSSFPVRVLDGAAELPGRVSVAGSFSRRFIKKSLHIKLADGRRWHDNSRISLKAMATDPSYLREWAAWDLAHALGMVTPRTEMARLFINGQFVGPFMFFDWIGADMMARRDLGDDGALYHPIDEVFCGGLGDASIETLKTCWNQFAPKNGDFSELATLARELADTPAEGFDRYLESRFDTDSVINWILLNTITSNTDSYNKNYFLYQSRKTGKWVVVPWDFDLSFGRNADPVLPFPKSIFNGNFQYFYTPELGNPHPLKEKLLRNAALYQRYKSRLAHVLGVTRDPAAPEASFGWFEPEQFRARIESWAQVIEVDVAHDRYRANSQEEFREHIEALDHYNLMRYHLLRHQVLEPNIFGSARWLPYTAYPPLNPPPAGASPTRQQTPQALSATVTLISGVRVVPVEEQFSRPLGVFEAISPTAPVQVRIEAETERIPMALPAGKTAAGCIQRNWLIDVKTPGTAVHTALTVDYLEESSIHHELGERLADQRRLVLWANAGDKWQRLPTRTNPVAKTLNTKALELQPGQIVRLVACAE